MFIKSFKSFRTVTIASLAMGATLSVAPAALAKGFQVGVRDCASVKGKIAVDTSNVSAWNQVKSNNPSAFVKSMLAESSCFAMADMSERPQYTLRFGPLTAQEYSRGPNSFSGRSVLEPAASSGGIPQAGGIPQSGGGIPQSGGGEGLSLGGVSDTLYQAERTERRIDNAEYYAKNIDNIDDIGSARRSIDSLDGALNSLGSVGNMFGSKAPKDRYAYVEVLNSSGQVLARGFGQNNRADLDFSHWSTDKLGVDSFSDNKKSRRAGGALYNAFNDAQNRILSPSFGSPIGR